MKSRRFIACFTPSFLPPYSLTSIGGSPLAVSTREAPAAPGAFASLMRENLAQRGERYCSVCASSAPSGNRHEYTCEPMKRP